MDLSQHNMIVNFIWSIADDCLRDVYVRGKYRDVILPMIVIRRIDALLEPTKKDVLKFQPFWEEAIKGMITYFPQARLTIAQVMELLNSFFNPLRILSFLNRT